MLLAASPAVQPGGFYQCAGQRIKILSCDGPGEDAGCEVESYAPQGLAAVHSRMQRKALRNCRAAAKAVAPGRPPKAGLARCSGKIEGTYLGPSGYPAILFYFGKASVEGGDEVECWTGGGKIYLHTPGTPADQDFVMGMNGNGTLNTPLGEMKRK
ncbi:MAG TPA: hypothetical protein VKT81_26155 [Bryobacteraceae bacterium]|nr:hypothetical protein [Bryobacteraceae bacterium]